MTESLAPPKSALRSFKHGFCKCQTTAPKEFERMASGYRLEIERMQSGVLDYLLRPAKVA